MGFTNKQIDEYNERRKKLDDFKIKKEMEYQFALKDIDNVIVKLNEILEKDGFEERITKENFDEMYVKLKEKNEKIIEDGLKIMAEQEKEMKELA